MTERRYADPTALRRAVTDRLRTLARDQHAQLADLQRQFAYDRFLARLFVSEPDRWVLKGATALLARLGGAAPRGSAISRSATTSSATLPCRRASWTTRRARTAIA